jgi:hypothetical protein
LVAERSRSAATDKKITIKLKMKKIVFIIAILGIIAVNVSAQNPTDSTNNAVSDFLSQVIQEQNSNAYNRSGWTVGFVNTMRDSFNGAQIGFLNTVTDNARGGQVGFVNTVAGSFNGGQVAFLNTATNDTKGAQVGFVNTVRGDFDGGQVGFINTATSDVDGAQVGFINTAAGGVDGAQIGFVNTTAGNADGTQIGFVNIARKLNGLQLGFVNFTDEAESGVPIGFLSIVRRGGYRAVELSVSEFHLMNVGFKIGVERFYTTFSVGYNPFEEQNSNRFATGIGAGTIIPMGDSFFFNPEMTGSTSLGRNNRNSTSFVPYFGYNFSDRFSITVAPSVTWSNSPRNTDLLEPIFSIANFEIDDRNEIVIGARISVRWRL